MAKDLAFSLVFMMAALNSWLPMGAPFVFAFAAPPSEDVQGILPSMSEDGRDRTEKIFLAGKAREDAEVIRSLEGFLPKVVDGEEQNALYCNSGEMDKRRLRTNKRRLRGSKRFMNDDKRRLRFVKRHETADDDGLSEEDGLSPRLRFRDLRKRETSLA